MHIDPVKQRIDANELNHHGVLGMKWGIRHDPERKGPRKAKKIQKDLDKTITDIFGGIYDYNNLHEYGKRLNKKTAERLIKDTKKGTISKKTLKMQDKLGKVQERLDAMKADIITTESKIDDLLKEASIGGYKIENIKRNIIISRYPEIITYRDVDAYKISKNK